MEKARHCCTGPFPNTLFFNDKKLLSLSRNRRCLAAIRTINFRHRHVLGLPARRKKRGLGHIVSFPSQNFTFAPGNIQSAIVDLVISNILDLDLPCFVTGNDTVTEALCLGRLGDEYPDNDRKHKDNYLPDPLLDANIRQLA